MQPIPDAPTPAPAATEPVIELIRTRRAQVGYVLTALAVAFLIATVALALKSNRIASAAPDKDKDGDPAKALQLDASEVVQPNRFDYVVGALGTALGLIITAAGGAYLIVGLPKLTEAEQRREARVLVLAVGGLLGTALILIGALLFVRWSDSMVKWLDGGDMKEARWVLVPLLMVVAGGAGVFGAIQPARAEERNDPTVRRLVYGSNFALTALMLFVVLVIANAVVAMRVQNKLDTTSTGFYTLNPQTVQLIEGLEQPIQVYVILQDGGDPITGDIKRLLTVAQDTNPSKFRVKALSPALNRTEIAKLRSDYPLAETGGEGVLLVTGEEGATERKRHSFIRYNELAEEKRGPDGQPTFVFNGEPKLLRELMFLAENKNKPKIYFTQSSGELALAAAGRGGDARRTAATLKSYLEKNYFDVAELTFDVGAPAKVPDDAAVVVVADPSSPLPPNAVGAIQQFMSDPRPNGKKGKLIVLAGGSQRGADERPLKSGLDPLLATYGIQLSDRFLFSVPSERADPRDRDLGMRLTIAAINPEAVQARNPVALGFVGVERLQFHDCRELSVNPAGAFQTQVLLSSLPGRTTWSEPLYTPSPVKTWNEFTEQIQRVSEGPGTNEQKQRQIDDLVLAKQISRRSHNIAAFVSEGDTARAAVFGCGWFVSDDASSRLAQNQPTTIWLDLMGSTLDWIRDRPTVGAVTEKQYSFYQMKPGQDNLRLTIVPLVLAFLIVLGSGAGVWVIRRK